MTVLSGLDAAGRHRSPATMPGYHAGCPPRKKGIRYPADPPTVDEIVAVMRPRQPARVAAASDDRGALACRTARPGGACARRARPRSPARVDPGPLRQGRPPPRGRDGRVGRGTPAPLADRTRRSASRTAVVHHRWSHPRAPVVGRSRPHRVPPSRGPGGCQAPVRAAPAAPCALEGAPRPSSDCSVPPATHRPLSPRPVVSAARGASAPPAPPAPSAPSRRGWLQAGRPVHMDGGCPSTRG